MEESKEKFLKELFAVAEKINNTKKSMEIMMLIEDAGYIYDRHFRELLSEHNKKHNTIDKNIKSFVCEFDRINEGLKNRKLNADAVVNISELPLGDNGQKGTVLVYYKE